MAKILIALPNKDFDPTEAGVPWQILRAHGHSVQFTTPDGTSAAADPRMVTGQDLGLVAGVLRADARGRAAHDAMVKDAEFLHPISYSDVRISDFDGLFLPGGHAQGVKPYLESIVLQAAVLDMFAFDRPVAAVCHGVVVAARARGKDGRSVLFGRRTTALTAQMELSAWWLTRAWLGDYYRTYPETVQAEVTRALAKPQDFDQGPVSLRRDNPARLDLGFVVQDGNYLSARWPGDVHSLGERFAKMF